MGEVVESLLGKMKKNKRRVTTENTETQVGEKKNESKHGSHLEEGDGGTQRCTARSKLPGINLEVTVRRMQEGGGREGWSQVWTRQLLTWQKNWILKNEQKKKRGTKGERAERGINARSLA